MYKNPQALYQSHQLLNIVIHAATSQIFEFYLRKAASFANMYISNKILPLVSIIKKAAR